ncbi:MAG: Secretion system C-terminal sorting domain [Bacteroidetes bacterium]|jgi:hypothetical protein|nr:Secretion system C-terminal sorting domain [Bacteroidota bacterium]
MHLKTFLYTCLFSVLFLPSRAQLEYLVTVDPSDISFVKIDTIPTVAWITLMPASYDQEHQRYIFRGADSNFNWKLYTLDAPTGAVLHDPVFPGTLDPGDNILYPQYSDSLDHLLGVYWDNSAGVAIFGTIDLASGAFFGLDSIHGMTSILESTYDNNANRYFLRVADANGIYQLLSIDASSGTIVSSVACSMPPNGFFHGMCFSNSLNKLFALHWDPVSQTISLTVVDPLTGIMNDLAVIPNMYGVESSFTTFDELNKRYTVKGVDNAGTRTVYTLDALTGAIVYNPLFPGSENIILPCVDRSSGIMYALHWEEQAMLLPEPTGTGIRSLFPNPCHDRTSLILDKAYREVQVFLYTSSGQLLKQIKGTDCTEISIPVEDLKPGLYVVSVFGDHAQCGMIKMIVE